VWKMDGGGEESLINGTLSLLLRWTMLGGGGGGGGSKRVDSRDPREQARGTCTQRELLALVLRGPS
jgi:hypothetical protein